ncbi:MAG: acyl-CoA dehydrogenase family protein, partial [Alphaproteobacteria bacterium]
MSYTPPVDDIAFALRHGAGMDAIFETGAFPDLGTDDMVEIVREAGKFMGQVLAPLNRVGDTTPATLRDGTVSVPPGWGEAYSQWAAGGWCGLSAPQKFDGQDLPVTLNIAVAEMFNAANMAFAVGPGLTHGAIEALDAHGSDALKATFLPKMVSGQWAGTMNLTEPQAGTDLAALKSRAVRKGDGSYAITGTKIFITYGEHEMTENIIHLVLARLEDAPEGVKGISLFVVPKFLVNDDGTLGKRNDVKCIGLEHKLGLHGSPTCVMAYGEDGGATGYLVGVEHNGLAAMFTMMNNARLLIGIQGVGIAERAFQQALSFAQERRQGRAPGDPVTTSIAIIEHVDVRRMLTSMAALTGAARGICFAAAVAIDLARHSADESARATHQARADLLIPIAKGFSTDIGVEVATLGIQVHGGMGYIEETGAAQHLRDARIAPIYEGTNGI